MDTGYVVRYKDTDDTAKRHLQTLTEKGKVIWGQWANGQNILSRKTYRDMNEKQFYLYAYDSKTALLKMHCLRVMDKEEVVKEQLVDYIPSYYSINTLCSAYYLIDNIEVLPIGYAEQLANINTGTLVSNAKQINSCSPWSVTEVKSIAEITHEDEAIVVMNKAIEEKEDKAPVITNGVQDITDYSNTYVVYCYHSKSTNKEYIGLTNNITRRRAEHENPTSWKGSKKFLYVLMNLLGLNDFTFQILHSGLSEGEAHYWEAREIEKRNCYYPQGLNERNESQWLERNKNLM